MTPVEKYSATILYVDDEELARKYFARMAGDEFDVLTASCAHEALALLMVEDCRISVLVTDYRMPGTSGGDLLRDIALYYPHLVCVLVTAYANKDVLLETINAADVFRILEKPLEAGHVRAVLQQASGLAQHRAVHRQRLVAMNETLAFLSHELTTPLATIANYARGINRIIASTGGLQPNLQDIETAVGTMQDSARYCLDVLMTFMVSVRHADKMPMTARSVPAGQVVRSLLDTFPLTPAQRRFVEVEVVEDFRIAALPNIVSLVLAAILHNALRAVKDHAAPALRATVLVGGRPEIRIADNGTGIVPEVLERLLAHPVTTHAGDGGSGWGLMLCNRMMQAFGGSISIDSAAGSGTVVTLGFPAPRAVQRSHQ